MAEIIGIVASGISIGTLSGQIASSILKLKSYWDIIHDAPSDILNLLDDIEVLQIVLSSIEEDQSRDSYSNLMLDGASASRCLEHCQRGVQRLKDVVDDMAREMASTKKVKRRCGAAKMLFRKDRIERYRAQLAGAVRLLTLAHQVYMRSLIQLQPDIVAFKVSQLMAPQNFEIDDPVKEQQLSRGCKSDISKRHTKTLSSTTYWIQHRSASRLAGLAWNIALSNSACGWKFSASLKPAVPGDSLVVQYTKAGNVEKLKEIFSGRSASPFCIVCESWGEETLLEVATRNGRYETCRFLLELGVEPSLRWDDESASQLLVTNAWYSERISSPQEYAKIIDIMALRFRFTLDQLFTFRGSQTAFSTFLQWTGIVLQNRSLSKRCSLAMNLYQFDFMQRPCPSIFRQALQCSPISLLAATWRHESGCSLLHLVAEVMGDLYPHDLCGGRNKRRLPTHVLLKIKQAPHDLLEWDTVLKELIDANAALHAQGSFDSRYGWYPDREGEPHFNVNTPMLSMISGFLNSFVYKYKTIELMSKPLILWLRVLQSLGVNLMAYGVEEARLWEQREAAWECTMYMMQWKEREGNWWTIGLIGFEYGPSPEDWKLWLSEPTDIFAGKFWHMIETPQEIMPGSWID